MNALVEKSISFSDDRAISRQQYWEISTTPSHFTLSFPQNKSISFPDGDIQENFPEWRSEGALPAVQPSHRMCGIVGDLP
jgi:hypothetical protein